MALQVDAPPAYKCKDDFLQWVDSLELYMCAVGVFEPVRKRALMLHLLGPSVQQKVKSVGAPEDASTDVYEHTKTVLTGIFAPKTRPVLERNIFHNMNLDEEEDVLEFVKRLRAQALKCQFEASQTDWRFGWQLENSRKNIVFLKKISQILIILRVPWPGWPPPASTSALRTSSWIL